MPLQVCLLSIAHVRVNMLVGQRAAVPVLSLARYDIEGVCLSSTHMLFKNTLRVPRPVLLSLGRLWRAMRLLVYLLSSTHMRNGNKLPGPWSRPAVAALSVAR